MTQMKQIQFTFSSVKIYYKNCILLSVRHFIESARLSRARVCLLFVSEVLESIVNSILLKLIAVKLQKGKDLARFNNK